MHAIHYLHVEFTLLQGNATLLHEAAASGNVEACALLLQDNSNFHIGRDIVNITDEMEWTPLHDAVFEGRIATLQLLLKYGASVNAITNVCLEFRCSFRSAVRP